jgi:hypothetical protein
MTIKKTVAGALPEIAVLRQQVADSQASAYGALIGYSGFLNKQWADDWFDLEYVDLRDGTSDLAKLVRSEQKALYAVLKASKHTNPSKVWSDVRKYAKRERYPETEKKQSTSRSHKDRAIGEIAPIMKSIIRDEKASAKDLQFKDLVTDAFVKAYGIDITKH